MVTNNIYRLQGKFEKVVHVTKSKLHDGNLMTTTLLWSDPGKHVSLRKEISLVDKAYYTECQDMVVQ